MSDPAPQRTDALHEVHSPSSVTYELPPHRGGTHCVKCDGPIHTHPEIPSQSSECVACEIQLLKTVNIGGIDLVNARKMQDHLREIDPEHHALLAELEQKNGVPVQIIRDRIDWLKAKNADPEASASWTHLRNCAIGELESLLDILASKSSASEKEGVRALGEGRDK